MPRRVANQKIILTVEEDGATKRKVIKAGEAYNFSAEDLKGLPAGAVRQPINEDEDTSMMTADELAAHQIKQAEEQDKANAAAKAEAKKKSDEAAAKAAKGTTTAKRGAGDL